MFLESLKKPFFISLIASVFLAACWGIVIVLLGRFSLFETRILMTTLIVAAGSLGGLACSTGLRKQSRFGQDRFIEITALPRRRESADYRRRDIRTEGSHLGTGREASQTPSRLLGLCYFLPGKSAFIQLGISSQPSGY